MVIIQMFCDMKHNCMSKIKKKLCFYGGLECGCLTKVTTQNTDTNSWQRSDLFRSVLCQFWERQSTLSNWSDIPVRANSRRTSI
jgi:hypothetical protein